MNQVATLQTGRSLSGAQVDLIKRTVAKDTSAQEFDHFMHTASHLGLDPLRKQILCIVFNKNNADKRNMTIIVPQDGLRVIAARQGDYGPAREEPEIEYDAEAKSATNPHGIVRAKVTLWKLYADGWQPVVGVAYWDEFAAVEDEWAYDPEQNKRAPTGKQKLADNWKRMGRVMIAKCATCQALRAGWPDDFAGVYGEEEMQRAVIIDAASEVVAEHQEQQRLARIGSSDGLLFVFEAGGNLVQVERGQVADRLTFFYQRQATTAQEIIDFRTRNEASLKTFWAWAPNDALEVKKIAEQRVEALSAKAPAVTDDASLFETLKAEGLAIISVEGEADRLAAHGKWLANVNAKQGACSEAEREEIKTLKKTIKSELGQNSAGLDGSVPAESGASMG